MDNHHPVSWVNGEPASEVLVSDRGLAYGDGLFETIRVRAGVPTLFDLHCKRLCSGVVVLGIPFDLEAFKNEVRDFLQKRNLKEGVLKAIVTRGSGGRGYNPEGCDRPSRILSFHPLPAYPDDPAIKGVRLHRCKIRLGDNVFAGIKHLNRLENVMARSEWQGTECLEGLLLGMDDRLIEGTMSNLFLISGKTLRTPGLGKSGVKGVCRDLILEQACQWGFQAEVGDYHLQDLAKADEVFVCNSVNGVWPVIACGHLHWSVGSVTRTVRDKVQEVLNA
ncbi:aminodeoxychorismate lyase [Endozoicomonas sp. 8E]|uniref:aminodeoxychorismate lyase n=1 Tax=Endozoicomonas sp. 8E TaxID=3035692 RepID=UPI002938FE81|nr:aminodeoxychorismate lyase [Endozoicomonas sp. 8E]WOG25761.1 aminodeoxychorismate lyase [Endozoicomonas sp. 8E]